MKALITKKNLLFTIPYILSLGIIAFEVYYNNFPEATLYIFIFPILASLMLFQNRYFYVLLLLLDLALLPEFVFLIRGVEEIIFGMLILNIGLSLVGEYFLWMLRKEKKSHERIKENEKKYRELYSLFRTSIDNAPDLIWAKNMKGEYIFANRAMCEKLLCAKNTDEPVGKTDLFFAERERAAHPKNREWHTFGELCVNSDQIVIDSRQPNRFDEFGNIRGEYLHLDVYKSPVWGENGEMIGVFGSGRDITNEKLQEIEKKKLEDELKKKDAFYKEFVESLNQIIIIADTKARIIYANKATEKIMGYSHDEIMKMSPLDVIHPDYGKEVVKALNRALTGEKIINFEYQIKHKTGKFLYQTATVFPQVDENGKVKAFTIFAFDNTELKEMHDALIAQNNKMTTILKSIPETIFIIDKNFEIEESFFSNEKWANDSLKYFNGNFKESFRKYVEETFNSKNVVRFTYELRNENSVRYFQAEIKYVELSENPKALLTVSDITDLKEIELELEESKFQFKNLLDNTYDWEYWISTDNRILYTSPSCFQITGYEPEEFINDPELLMKIIVPQDRKLYREHLKKHKGGKKPGKMQFKISKKNGEMRIIRHTCQGVFDREGKYIGRRVTNRNSTDRYIEEQKAIQAEQKYHEIFNSLMDVYYQVDEKSVITMISPSVKTLAGYEPEELIGKKSSVFYDSFKEFKKVRDILVANKGGNNIEVNLKTKSGKIKTASLNTKMILDANGKFKGFQGILRDISRLKKIQSELEKAKNEAQKYLSIAQTMIVVLDRNNNVTLINQKGCEILEYQEKEIVGKNWIESFLTPEFKETAAVYFKKLSKGEIEFPSEMENEIITRSGKKRLIKWYNTILWDDNDQFEGLLSAGVDITDERKMLSKIQKSESELKELNAAKDKFFSIISHDLRSPFTSLLGYTQLASEEFDELEKKDIKFYVDAIRRISVRIFELIKELLEWSYVQTGRIQIELQTLLVKNCVISAIELHTDSLKNKSIKIENIVDEKVTVFADESAFHTVLRNLLGNAIKFTPAGGKITIASKKKGEYVIISVKDTGVGIDPDDLNKLFKIGENFTRNGTDGEQGTGLGLILCKELISKMNGEIWAESRINTGSTFYVKLPQKKE